MRISCLAIITQGVGEGNYVAPHGVCLTLVIWSSLEHVKSGLTVEHSMEYELSQDLN